MPNSKNLKRPVLLYIDRKSQCLIIAIGIEMKVDDIKTELSEYLESCGSVLYNVPARSFSSYQTGGNVDLLVYPDGKDGTEKIIKVCRDESIPLTILGGGTNVLIGDKGIRGVVIRLSSDGNIDNTLSFEDDDTVYCDATVRKEDFIDFCLDARLEGIEFMAGIPGSIGGGIFMNAGTSMGSFTDICTFVNLVKPDGEFSQLAVTEETGEYRRLNVEAGTVILGAYFKLQRAGNPGAVRRRIEGILEERRCKHPLEYPSAGSVFKNPEGLYAWKLVNDAKLKGFMIGGAQVSEKHTNFIINYNNATSKDIRDLIEHVKGEVFRKFNITLETEIKMIGEFSS